MMSLRGAAVLLVVSTWSLSACLRAETGPGGPTGRVHGQALAGPTCPVERPGDSACDPRPVVGVVEFRSGDRVVSEAGIDAQGSFDADVPVGHYTITVDVGDEPFPSCRPIEVDVGDGTDTELRLECDTGIR